MEIEVRAFIDDLEATKSKLKQLDAEKVDETVIEDRWFCNKEVTSYEETKMNKVGSYGLRLRHQQGKPPEITVKTIIREGDHQIFGEEETEIENIETMEKILILIGFKKFCTVKKKRETYKFANMKLNLEDIEGFSPCIEIEIIDDKTFDEHKETIHKVMNMLEIDEEKRIDTSITSLFMEQYAFKQ